LRTRDLLDLLVGAGFEVVEVRDNSQQVTSTARRLVQGLRAERTPVAQELGAEAVDDLLATLAALADMLSSDRLQEVALVAQRLKGA
jgi:hypothetical protein